MMKHIWLIFLLPFLTQCSPSPSTTSGALPILSSPGRAQAWGKPQSVQTKDGYYTTYINPSNRKERIRIIASRQMMPFFVYPPNITGTQIINGVPTKADIPQSWKTASINGTKVKWYQSSFPSSQRAAIFRTLGVELKDSSGARGQFRIQAEGTKNQVQTWLSELRLGQQ